MLQGIILSTQTVWPFTMGLGFNGNLTLVGSMQVYYAMKGKTQKEGESGKKAQSVYTLWPSNMVLPYLRCIHT